jgi:hypothetical protein
MIKDFEKRVGQQAYQNIIAKLRMSTGLSYAMIDALIRQFANELADELAVSETVIVPEMGIYRMIRPDGVKPRASFAATRGFKEIYKNGGLQCNKDLREQGILPESALQKYLKGGYE